MTVNEAARELGILPATVRIQILRGVIPAHKIGRDWIIAPEAVDRYRADHLGRPGRRPKDA